MGVRRGLAAWSAGAVYAVSAAACCALAARTSAHFVDLQVYRMGGQAVLHDGSRLYQLRFAGLPFTYPPFAAVIFTSLAVVPWRVAVAVLTGASVAALPTALYLMLRLPGPSRMPTGPAWTVALATATAAIWLEPARATLGYGQVDILLTAAVLYDLSLPDTARGKGLMIGLSAGLKLTPAIFAVYLLVTGRLRAAATAAVAFAGTVAAGFALPASSAWFWAGRFATPGHVSPVQDPQNQSLSGVLARVMHTADILPMWLPLAVAVAVAVAGLSLAAAASRRGDEALGFSLCAVTGLLVSPISWIHHWVIVIPALLVAGLATGRAYRAGNVAAAVFGTAVITAIAVIGWIGLAGETPRSGWLAVPSWAMARSASYVLIGLAALVAEAWNQVRSAPSPAAPGTAGQRRTALPSPHSHPKLEA